jgi:protein-disulfide isomerase
MAQTKSKNKSADPNKNKPVTSQSAVVKDTSFELTATQKKRDIARRQAKKHKQEIVTLLILGSIVVLVVVIMALLVMNAPENPNKVSAANQPLLVRSDSISKGPANAPVTIVEFLDPECEACRAAHPQIEQLLKQYDGKVRMVARYFLGHSNSTLAIAATEAAGEQGKYWEMQTLLFSRQSEWGEKRTPQTDLFLSYAQSLGLDIEKFKAGLQNPAYSQKATRDMEDARTLGVQGTPTFYVNGERVYGADMVSIRTLIDKNLNR